MRDQLYELARCAVGAYEREGTGRREEWAALNLLSQEDRDAVEERAAVLEFDANMARSSATRMALVSHLQKTVQSKKGR